MPSNPLTDKEIFDLSIKNNLPSKRFFATHPSNSSKMGYYDIDAYMSFLGYIKEGEGGSIEQIQSDWNQSNSLLVDFIKNKPTTFPPTAHTHDDRYYTETEIDSALSTKSNTGHNHTSSDITDFQSTVSSNTDVVANTAARHTHSNISTLNAITEAFTTALKTAYDNVVTWISTNGANLISHLTNTSNPHNVTKTQIGLSDVTNVDTTTTANITDSLDKRFITDAKKTVLDNTSNTNTGDETTESIQTKRPLKTVNGESLEGVGNIVVDGGVSSGDVVGPDSSTNESIARFDGLTGKLLKNSTIKITDNGSLILPENSNPTPASSGELKLFAREISGRILPAFVGPSGLDSTLQPLLARNKVGYWNPPGNATTVPGVFGFTAPTITGFTAQARNVAVTNLFTRMRRLGYQTAATVGAVGQWRVGVYQYTLGDGEGLGGFTYIKRFGISDAANVATARMFIGMRASSTPSNVEPSTLTNCIGIGHGASDSNMKLFYGGSVAQTPIDLGINFPANTRNTDVYELALFSSPNTANTVNWTVTRLNTGDTVTGTISGNSTVIPQSNTLIAPWGYRTNNATALAVAIDVMSVYIETDQ